MNICDLERCHPDDALLLQLANGEASPTSLVAFTTQLLSEVHQHMVHLLMVRSVLPAVPAGGAIPVESTTADLCGHW